MYEFPEWPGRRNLSKSCRFLMRGLSNECLDYVLSNEFSLSLLHDGAQRQTQLSERSVSGIDDFVFFSVACIVPTGSFALIQYEFPAANFLKTFSCRPMNITNYNLISLLL